MTKKNRNEVVRPRTVNKEWAEIGRRVREAMAPAGFHTQSALAKAIGVGDSTLAQILNGQQQPDINKIKALAAVLKTTAGVLMGEAEAPPSPQRSTGDTDSVSQAFTDYVAKHKDSLTENEIKGLLDGSYQLDDVVPDEQAISDFLRAKRALLERLRRRPASS